MQSEWQKEKNEEYRERHELSIERIKRIAVEDTVEETFRAYFQNTALFMLELEAVRRKIEDGSWESLSLEDMKAFNKGLYVDILPERYGKSFANPVYTAGIFGEMFGQILSFLYAEMRGGIPYAFENRLDYLTILNELFIEVYNCFEDGLPEYKEIKDIIYWYASDYCDVFLADRIEEQLYPERSFAVQWIMNADLEDEKYLYRTGEYITENELRTAEHLSELPEETLQKKIGRAHV